MQNAPNRKIVENLTVFLKRMSCCEDPKFLRKEAGELIGSVTNRDIERAERNLIASGFSTAKAQELSAAFLLIGILEGQSAKLRENLPDNHILRAVMAEHEMVRCFIADLRDVTEAISQMDELTDRSSEFMKLCHIVKHLKAMHEHIEREDDILFPLLEKAGWGNLCSPARNEHTYIEASTDELVKMTAAFDPKKDRQFKTELSTMTGYMVPIISEHLFYEENILYPIAVEVIKDQQVWVRMKELCEQIGYCGVHA